MCGIVGLSYRDAGNFIKPMTDRISHRGPDNLSTWSSSNVGLGHARLSIIDTSMNNNQPLWDVNNRYCIIFNGEIYNYLELKERLIDVGVNFATAGDTEVLLYAIIHYGVDILKEIEGIFSFCLFDSHKNTFLLGRDKFGVKPLYYYYDKKTHCFMFSSEFKSFLEVPIFKKEICHDSLYRSLLFLYNPGNNTLFKSVKKLPAASFLKYNILEGVNIEKYWDWPKYDPIYNSIEEINEIEKLIKESVKKQTVSDVPIASFLSGGVDSSLICSAVNDINIQNEKKAFTIKSVASEEDGFEDDLPFAKKVSKDLKFDLEIVNSSPDSIKELLHKFIYHLDEINADPAALNVFQICELAKSQGIKVMLSGTGGDDLFSGYRRHQAIRLEKYWTYTPVLFRRFLKAVLSKLPSDKKIFRRIKKLLNFSDLSSIERIVAYHFWCDPQIVRNLFKNEEDLSQNPTKFIEDQLESLETSDMLEQSLYLEREFFLRDHNLQYTDKMSMATGVEVRVPFLDTKIIEFTQKISSTLKMKKGITKFVLKDLMKRKFSHELAYRKKTGFGVPLRKWIKNDLKSYIELYLSEENIKKRGIFKPEAIKSLIAENLTGREDYSYLIFALLCTEIWFQIFIDENQKLKVN